jgi:predicted DNA-binding transcriptional regulator AlpA
MQRCPLHPVVLSSRYPIGYNAGMAKKIDPEEYVRVGTAAKIAGVTRAYINRLISQGRFPAICIDGQNFVRRADAEKFANPPKN